MQKHSRVSAKRKVSRGKFWVQSLENIFSALALEVEQLFNVERLTKARHFQNIKFHAILH